MNEPNSAEPDVFLDEGDYTPDGRNLTEAGKAKVAPSIAETKQLVLAGDADFLIVVTLRNGQLSLDSSMISPVLLVDSMRKATLLAITTATGMPLEFLESILQGAPTPMMAEPEAGSTLLQFERPARLGDLAD